MKLLYVILLILPCFIIAQDNFSDGFKDGFCKGYNDKDACGSFVNCPNPPNAPNPLINQSIDSYNDGYNAGYKQGLKTGMQDCKKIIKIV